MEDFKCFGSRGQSNKECREELAGTEWRKVSGTTRDQRVSARMKGEVLKMVVGAVKMYGLEAGVRAGGGRD